MLNKTTAFHKTVKAICFILLISVLFSLAIPAAAISRPPEVTDFRCSSLGSHTLQLSWTKVKNADGYVIYQADNDSNNFKQIGRSNYNGTCIVKNTLDANTHYKFAIKAYYTYNGVRYLSNSYPVVKVQTLPPTAKNISLSLSERRIHLTWSASSKADGYRVYYSTNGGKKWTFYEDTEKTSLRRKDLKSGREYMFGIKVYRYINGRKYVSRDMPKVKGVTLPDTPNFTYARKGDLFHINFALCDGATGYLIYAQKPGGNWVRQNVTVIKRGTTYRRVAFTINNAPAKVYLTVKAVKKVGNKNYYGDFRKKLCSTITPKGTVLSFGDSIAKGTGSHWWTYSDMLADKLNYKTADHKFTVSGASIGYNPAPETAKDDRLYQMVTSSIKKGKNYTYILLEGGRNDYYYNEPIGKVTAEGTTKFNNSTVCGALETTLYHLKVNSPKSRVIFVIIHDCDGTSKIPNDIGLTFTDYANAFKRVCAKYHVGVADVFSQSGFNTGSKSISEKYTFHYFGVYPQGDGVHPTEFAYEKFYLPAVEKAMKGLKPIGSK
ncbi:MAG: hypothetical protein IJJ41_06455 [Clostridia bacterium]|nr:hypothetical protein [Clostridia bacterium]